VITSNLNFQASSPRNFKFKFRGVVYTILLLLLLTPVEITTEIMRRPLMLELFSGFFILSIVLVALEYLRK